MNKQNKDGSISWTDYTWNPILGLCPVDCKLPDGRSYCYARAMYKRFKWNPEVKYGVTCSEYKQLRFLKPGTKVFVCSTFELFHPAIKKEWRDIIFKIIESNPQHIFQILTKIPENIDRPMPDNVWLGCSITNFEDYNRRNFLLKSKAKIKFISLEPLLGFFPASIVYNVDWVIIGRLTGHGKRLDPPISIITNIVRMARAERTPIFLKNNLKEIWGEKLIQEFPIEED